MQAACQFYDLAKGDIPPDNEHIEASAHAGAQAIDDFERIWDFIAGHADQPTVGAYFP